MRFEATTSVLRLQRRRAVLLSDRISHIVSKLHCPSFQRLAPFSMTIVRLDDVRSVAMDQLTTTDGDVTGERLIVYVM